MKIDLRFRAWPIVLIALLPFSTSRALGSPTAEEESPTADCSFSNPKLPGWCFVTTPLMGNKTSQLACEAVLRCLKSSACTESEKYCYNPGVAKNWKLEEAKPTAPRVECAYSNPNFSGWCRLNVSVPDGSSPRGACEALLPCLKGAPCPGSYDYCHAPEVRSGWRLEEVRPSVPQPTPRP